MNSPIPNLDPSLFVAGNHPGGGYTWTLPSRLGEMLQLAESLFGERDRSWTILGVEIGPDTAQLWYPKTGRRVIIRLHASAATDMDRACFQLAHETVHLLAPNGGGAANNLEEGVACYFAADYMRTVFDQPTWREELPSYARARSLISARLDEDIHCIRRLRAHQPAFDQMTRESVKAEFPGLSSEDLEFLLSKFERAAL